MSLMARNRRLYSLTLPVGMGSQRYNLVRWTPRGVSLGIPSEASSRNMADECEDLHAILFVADLAIYGVISADGSPVDEWNDTLLRFRHICKLPWLAEKDIILFFLNWEELSRKPPNMPAPSHTHKDYHLNTTDEIIKLFVSYNEDESRKIYVFFADDNVKAKNLEAFEKIVEQILSKRVISAGTS